MNPADITLSDFINTIFPDVPEDERVCLTVKTPNGWESLPGSEKNLQRLVRPGDKPWYVCLSTVAPQEDGYLVRNRDSLRCLYAIVLDDVGTKVDMDAVTVAPSWVIETSDGNYQYGYILDPIEITPESEAHYEACQRGLAEAGLTDGGARGTYRVVRVPGSLHRTGFVATLRQWFPERFWALDELMAQFGVKPAQKRTRRALAPTDREPLALHEIDDPVFEWLEEHGHTTGECSDKFVEVICPWHGEHTTGSNTASFTPAGYDHPSFDHAFSCFHEHCQGRRKKQFLAWVAEQGGPDLTAPQAPTRTVRLERTELPDLRVKADGTPTATQLASRANIEWVIERSGVDCRFNMMTGRGEFLYEGKPDGRMVVEDALLWLGIPATNALVPERLEAAALKHRYHPMEEWLRSLSWDGQDRLGALQATVETHTELWPVYMRRWLVQVAHAVTRWREGPHQYPYVLTFTGPQGTGKSTWFANLVPKEFFMGEASIHLERSTAKDDMINALGAPIAELSEIDTTFRKSDVGALKAFLSRPVDKIRLPYAREAIHRNRVTVFCGSVNETEFLMDTSGSRRFWPVATERFIWDHGIDMEQVWAQVCVLLANGEDYHLSAEENRQRIEEADFFTHNSAIKEAIETYFTPQKLATNPAQWVPVTMGQLGEILNMAQALRAPVVRTEAAAILTKLFGPARKINGIQKARRMPVPTSDQARFGRIISGSTPKRPPNEDDD